jgi:hypothetical protein
MKRDNAWRCSEVAGVSTVSFSGDPRSRHRGFTVRRWDFAHSRAESVARVTQRSCAHLYTGQRAAAVWQRNGWQIQQIAKHHC